MIDEEGTIEILIVLITLVIVITCKVCLVSILRLGLIENIAMGLYKIGINLIIEIGANDRGVRSSIIGMILCPIENPNSF